MVKQGTRLLEAGMVALACALLCLYSLAFAQPAFASSPDEDAQTTPLLFVVVGFSGSDDHAATPYDNSYDWHEAIFGSEQSLATYYRDMSEGAFTFAPARETCAYTASDPANVNTAEREDDGVVHVTLSRPHGNWGLVNEDQDVSDQFSEVVVESFEAAKRYLDCASYDRNGDSLITPDELAVCFCIAGYDASPFANPGRSDIPALWPHTGFLPRVVEQEPDDAHLSSYIAIAESFWDENDPPDAVRREPLGILYHELGHCLGLPDLYPLDRGKGVWSDYRVGGLSLMGSGNWTISAELAGSQSTPTSLDAWSRYALGWELPTIVTESGDYTVSGQYSESGYQTLLIPSPDPDQYYLVENRQTEGYDAPLSALGSEGSPAGGIVIWQVRKDMIRAHCRDDELNNTDHTPGVMPLFFERTDAGFTTDWTTGRPVAEQPFFGRQLCIDRLGDSSATIELPLYGSSTENGAPSARTGSGITVQFLDDPNRTMTVHVEFASTRTGTGANEYPLVDNDPARRHMWASALGRIACAAILDETEADIAIANEGAIRAGLPLGDITYAQAENMVVPDRPIRCYNLTGADIVGLIEESYANGMLETLAKTAGVELDQLHGDILNFAGISYEIALSDSGDARVVSAKLGKHKLDMKREYSVATIPSVAERYDAFGPHNRDMLVLWGSASDAIRSFVSKEHWETRAAKLTSDQVATPPPSARVEPGGTGAASATGGGAADGAIPLHMILALVGLGVLCVASGAIFTLIRRR